MSPCCGDGWHEIEKRDSGRVFFKAEERKLYSEIQSGSMALLLFCLMMNEERAIEVYYCSLRTHKSVPLLCLMAVQPAFELAERDKISVLD